MRVTVPGIEVDANGITRVGLRVILTELAKLEVELANNPDLERRIEIEGARDELSGYLAEKCITVWPFDLPINKQSYLSLSLKHSVMVDKALTEMLAWLSEQRGKKK